MPKLLTHLTALAVMSSVPAWAQDAAPVTTETATTTTTTTTNTDSPVVEAPPLATNEGWNSRWALLFSFNNILVNNNFVGSPVAGSIGANYFLSDDTAIRAGIGLSRQHNPLQVTKVTNTAGVDSVPTYQISNPGAYTQAYTVNARADYLKRLMKTAVAPYVGAGGQVSWSWTRNTYLDDVTVVDQRTEINNNTSSFDITARGIIGAEWRVHPHFAFYADYNVAVSLFNRTRLRNRTTVESTVGGENSTVESTSERDVNSYLNVSTGVSQGASLGLQIFF